MLLFHLVTTLDYDREVLPSGNIYKYNHALNHSLSPHLYNRF